MNIYRISSINSRAAYQHIKNPSADTVVRNARVIHADLEWKGHMVRGTRV